MYCGCTQTIAKSSQLMRAGLFPATEKRPKTAATFDFVESFHKLTLTSKVNLYDYFKFVIQRDDPLLLAQNLVSSRDYVHIRS
jgi:hypothetical protein